MSNDDMNQPRPMDVVIIGGGPHPNARVVGITELDCVLPQSFAIVDGKDVLAWGLRRSHAVALLPAIQSGE